MIMDYPDIKLIAQHFPLVPPLERMTITQPFGVNYVDFYKKLGMNGHNALDVKALTGTTLFSCLNGEVAWADDSDPAGYGIYIFLRTKPKQVGNTLVTIEVIYAHLQKLLVKTGQEVTEGQKIALSDNTGKYTTGAHLHFGVRPLYGPNLIRKENGYLGYEDPALFMNRSIIDVLPVDKRYGKKREFLVEKVFAFSPSTRRALGRLPTSKEISACTYGGWTLKEVADPAMFAVWTEYTKEGFAAKVVEMKGK